MLAQTKTLNPDEFQRRQESRVERFKRMFKSNSYQIDDGEAERLELPKLNKLSTQEVCKSPDPQTSKKKSLFSKFMFFRQKRAVSVEENVLNL